MPEFLPCAPGSPEWLAARRAGVTATDIVTILGLSRHDSPYSLYWRKLGQVPEVEDSDRFRLGRYLESYVIDRWLDAADPETFGGLQAAPGLFRHSERAWQMATLDAAVGAPLGASPRSQPLEVKTWADADRHSWQDGLPAAVRAQVLWQMDVMEVAVGHVGVVFLPSGEFRSYTIEHHPSHLTHPDVLAQECSICSDTNLMRAAGEEFMGRLRLELPPPDPDSSAATLAAVRARFAKTPDKTAEVDLGMWNAWYGAKSEADRWTETARGYESKLREQAGEASVLTVDGQPVARRIVSDAQVKAHARHMDYLKRIKTEADDDN